MKSTINLNQSNQSEVGDLKAGPLEYNTEAQFNQSEVGDLKAEPLEYNAEAQFNQSEVGDLKAGPLEYKAEAQFQALRCNILFSRLQLKFYSFLNIYF
jgi:hypothetical protein